jgi:NAD-dependent dihydropyrimidine dehydrogenase PreA subunit
MCSSEGFEGAGGPVGSAGVGALLTAAADALRALDEVVLDGSVPDAQVNAAVQLLGRVEAMAHGQKLRFVNEVDERRSYAAAGYASAVDLLVGDGLTRGEARSQVDAAFRLTELPQVAGLVRQGAVAPAGVQAISRGVEQVDIAEPDGADTEAVHAELDGFLAGLLAAGRMDRAGIAREVDGWAQRHGHDVLADRQRRAHARRGVRLWNDAHGMKRISGALPAVVGQQVATALDAIARQHDAASADTYAQRCADALGVLAARYLDEGALPQVVAQRPHVILLTREENLHDTPGVEPAVVDGVGQVCNDTVRQLCCDADITTVVTDERGDIRRVGNAKRTPTRKQRAAVVARDKACVGCAAPITRCQIHHIVWWRHDGETEIDNLTLVCWNCHFHIHHHGWTVWQDDDGRYRTGPPQVVRRAA